MNTIGVGREPSSKHISYPIRSGSGRLPARTARGCDGIINVSGIVESVITAWPLDGKSFSRNPS